MFANTVQKEKSISDKDGVSYSGLGDKINTNIKIGGGATNPSQMDTNDNVKSPTKKERWAYAIEFSAKIIYPICFLIYNVVYWTSHYGRYNDFT